MESRSALAGDEEWMARFESVKLFLHEHKRSPSPSAACEAERELALWCKRQKTEFWTARHRTFLLEGLSLWHWHAMDPDTHTAPLPA